MELHRITTANSNTSAALLTTPPARRLILASLMQLIGERPRLVSDNNAFRITEDGPSISGESLIDPYTGEPLSPGEAFNSSLTPNYFDNLTNGTIAYKDHEPRDIPTTLNCSYHRYNYLIPLHLYNDIKILAPSTDYTRVDSANGIIEVYAVRRFPSGNCPFPMGTSTYFSFNPSLADMFDDAAMSSYPGENITLTGLHPINDREMFTTERIRFLGSGNFSYTPETFRNRQLLIGVGGAYMDVHGPISFLKSDSKINSDLYSKVNKRVYTSHGSKHRFPILRLPSEPNKPPTITCYTFSSVQDYIDKLSEHPLNFGLMLSATKLHNDNSLTVTGLVNLSITLSEAYTTYWPQLKPFLEYLNFNKYEYYNRHPLILNVSGIDALHHPLNGRNMKRFWEATIAAANGGSTVSPVKPSSSVITKYFTQQKFLNNFLDSNSKQSYDKSRRVFTAYRKRYNDEKETYDTLLQDVKRVRDNQLASEQRICELRKAIAALEAEKATLAAQEKEASAALSEKKKKLDQVEEEFNKSIPSIEDFSKNEGVPLEKIIFDTAKLNYIVTRIVAKNARGQTLDLNDSNIDYLQDGWTIFQIYGRTILPHIVQYKRNGEHNPLEDRVAGPLAFKVSINSGSNHPISIALAEPWSIIGKLENDNFSMHPHTGTDIQTDGLRLFYQLDTVNVCGGEAVAQLQESASKQNIDGAIGIFLQWAGNAETGDPWGAKISAFPRKTEILRKGYLIADSQTLPTILKEQKIIMHHPENKDILHITYTPGLPNVEVTFYPNYRWQEGSPGVLISDEALETQKINVLPYLTKLTALEKQKHYLSLGFVLGEPVYTPPPATAPVVPTESGEETSFVSVLSKAIRAKSKNK